MQTPVDYPVNEDAAGQLDGPLTYATLFDLHEAQQPITEDMIRSAVLNMEAAQQMPFAARPETIDTNFAGRSRTAPVLSRLWNVIR
ncbi:hypothetical protein ACUNV4_12970 [Granulosicoccus sp. 3-233]|uniref:hypothetical protein n=1 Tax=Granulosicoccus sp. 3-233 TaxID=3417969 RepID=UPI003D32B2EC